MVPQSYPTEQARSPWKPETLSILDGGCEKARTMKLRVWLEGLAALVTMVV